MHAVFAKYFSLEAKLSERELRKAAEPLAGNLNNHKLNYEKLLYC